MADSRGCAAELRVMSYNVRYPSGEGGRNAWVYRRDPLVSTIRFHRPDIVGLQEVHHDRVDDFRAALPGFEWLETGRSGKTYGDHAAIGFHRERFTLETDGRFWLSETPDTPSRGWDAALVRLVRYVGLYDEVTDVSLFHFNTHFDHRGETARRRSAQLLRSRIDAISGDEPVVVTGDLNCRPGSEPHRRLTDESLSNGRALHDAGMVADAPNHGPDTSMTDFTDLVPEKKIDYVFVTPTVEVGRHGILSDSYGDGRYPSDHLPVLADVEVPTDRT
ncbi:endonuclease/exonuclease/phosphatase family protein [Halorientalis pallida]|nr:endonuclease/exonuclease/phosphatase family protein [Halorientalis pallida]